MNPNLKNFLVTLAITAATAAYTLAVFQSLPDRIPVHFDISGQPDRWESKGTGVWLMIWMMLGIGALFAILPILSPKTKSIEEFRPTYDRLTWSIPAFMALMQLITLNAGGSGSLPQVPFGLLMCALFGYLGNVMGKVTPNYFVGIRTPWTLESPTVWERTHRFTGRASVASAILGTIIVLLGANILFAIVTALLPLLIALPYSYYLYQQEGGKSNNVNS
jgi:uncharacterized membrane protein